MFDHSIQTGREMKTFFKLILLFSLANLSLGYLPTMNEVKIMCHYCVVVKYEIYFQHVWHSLHDIMTEIYFGRQNHSFLSL